MIFRFYILRWEATVYSVALILYILSQLPKNLEEWPWFESVGSSPNCPSPLSYNIPLLHYPSQRLQSWGLYRLTLDSMDKLPLYHRNRQPFTLTCTPTGSLESPINLHVFALREEGGIPEEEKKNSEHANSTEKVPAGQQLSGQGLHESMVLNPGMS